MWACFVISLSVRQIFDSLRGRKKLLMKSLLYKLFWYFARKHLRHQFPAKKFCKWKNYQGRSQSVGWIRLFYIIAKFLLNSNIIENIGCWITKHFVDQSVRRTDWPQHTRKWRYYYKIYLYKYALARYVTIKLNTAFLKINNK